MRFLIAILLTALGGWLFTFMLSWQAIAVAALLFAPLASAKPGRCFWAGFLGIFLLWLCTGLWRDVPNEHLLSGRLAKIFFVQEGYLYLLAAALIGGLVGGLGGWTGGHIYRALRRKIKFSVKTENLEK